MKLFNAHYADSRVISIRAISAEHAIDASFRDNTDSEPLYVEEERGYTNRHLAQRRVYAEDAVLF